MEIYLSELCRFLALEGERTVTTSRIQCTKQMACDKFAAVKT